MALGSKRIKITKAALAAMRPNSVLWDTEPGFGARRQHSDVVSFFFFYRTETGEQRRFTIGRFGKLTIDQARRRARDLRREVGDGGDPAREKQDRRTADTVATLCDDYLRDAEAGRIKVRGSAKRPSTLVTDRGRIERHIKPLLGKKLVADITRRDIVKFRNAVETGRTAGLRERRGRPTTGGGTATRTLGLLGAIFSYAVREGIRLDNPVRGVERTRDGERTRFLTEEEYRALGTALRAADAAGMWPPAVACIRFVALTGWRRGEATGLRWTDVDLDRQTATLPQTKTGRSIRPLPQAAVTILRAMQVYRGDDPAAPVFPPSQGSGVLAFARYWQRLGMPADITAHTLRHSYATVAGELGMSGLTVAALLGHRARTVTEKYVHWADSVLVATADTVASEIEQRMGASR